MGVRLIGFVAASLLLCACGSPESTGSGGAGSGGSNGPGGAGAGPGGSAGASASGGVGGSGPGGSGPGGSSSGGSAGSASLSCAPLAPPKGTIIEVDPSKASELPGIVSGAASGTTIVLAAGTYNIPSTIQITKSDVTLRSKSDKAEDVIIDGQYTVNEDIAISASNVTVAHITITRSVDHPIHVYPPAVGVDVKNTFLYGLRLIDGGEQFVKVNPNGSNPGYIDDGKIECSYFELTDAGRPHVEPCCGGCYTGGIDVHAGQNWQVRNNFFKGIYCPSGLAEHAIHFWKGSRGTLVENNVIVDCARGIGFGLGGGGGDRKYPDNPYNDPSLSHYDGIIRNNVVYGDVAGFDTGIEIDEAREPRVYHNTVIKGPNASGFYSGIDYRFASTVAIIRNNLTSRITQRDGAQGQVDNNLEMVPLSSFVDPAAADFHLAPGTTGIVDKGADLSEAGIDIDGEPHNLGAGPDLGADESTP